MLTIQFSSSSNLFYLLAVSDSETRVILVRNVAVGALNVTAAPEILRRRAIIVVASVRR
jgi:hypothetical protein